MSELCSEFVKTLTQIPIYDHQTISQDRSVSIFLLEKFKELNIQTLEEAKGVSLKATIPLKGLIVENGFSYDQSGYEKFVRHITRENMLRGDFQFHSEFDNKQINDGIIRLIDKCISQQKYGLWIIPKIHVSDPLIFDLNIQFKPFINNSKIKGKISFKVGSDFNGNIASRDGTNLNEVVISSSGKFIKLRREENKQVYIYFEPLEDGSQEFEPQRILIPQVTQLNPQYKNRVRIRISHPYIAEGFRDVERTLGKDGDSEFTDWVVFSRDHDTISCRLYYDGPKLTFLGTYRDRNDGHVYRTDGQINGVFDEWAKISIGGVGPWVKAIMVRDYVEQVV